MSKQAAYLQHILEIYPELHVTTSRLHEDGFFNDVLVLNEALIFRFPRSAEGVERLANELAVLHAIQNHVSLAVPQPIFYSHEQQAIGQVFIGYGMIPGEPIQVHLNTIESNIAYIQLASQLATFLKELHQVHSAGIALRLPTYVEGRRDGLVEIYEQIRTHLYPLLRDDACTSLTDLFDQFLSNPLNFQCTAVLRHGDLNPNNILFDSSRQQLCGIIDFGSTGLDDPAVDLGMVAAWGGATWGDKFAEKIFDEYQITEPLLKRVKFYRVLLSLMAAFEGLETGNQEMLALALAQYQ